MTTTINIVSLCSYHAFTENFMGGRGAGAQKKKVDTTKYYNLLNVTKEATQDEIKKSFRKIAIKEHPDKGGDAEKFKEITVAYEVLSDPEKRKLYDQVGEEGMQGGGQPQGFGDIFDMFGMGGRGGGGGAPQAKKVKPMGVKLEVSLEDLYNGKETTVEVERHRICSKCNGVGGSDPKAVQACKPCKGKGMRVMMMQLGPGMYSQRTAPCDECGGKGEVIDPAKMCKDCKGKKIKKEKKKLNVEVDKGAPSGEKYTKHGEGDEIPDAEAGDVIVILEEKKHKLFKRKGADLFMEKEITLYEALTGLDFVLTHLDGRKIRIKNNKGEVIKPESLFTVEKLGMPFHKRSYENGNLIIQFKIKFPDTINAKSSELLADALKGTGAAATAKGGKAATAGDKEEVAETCELK